MSSLHRRQSALNLPTSDDGSSTSPPSEIQPALSLTDVQDNENTSQGEPSPTSRSFRDKPSKTSGLSSRSSGRQFPLETNPELYDSQSSATELGQQASDTQRSRRGSRSRHLRTLSRDFVLPSMPSSSVRHENLTSLKDQFLKIKERFSPSVLPLSNTSTATVTPSCLVSEVTTVNNSALTTSSSDQATTTQVLSSIQAPPDHQTEGSWELPQARVERWYREDDFFKACITCWTMEAGAAIVSKVARVVSEWALDTSSTSSQTPPSTSSNAINPDVSLQWIGRQLWAVTVSLPLTRSGELHAEHITLAHRINQAVAEISKQTSSLFIGLPTAETPAAGVANEESSDPQPPLSLFNLRGVTTTT